MTAVSRKGSSGGVDLQQLHDRRTELIFKTLTQEPSLDKPRSGYGGNSSEDLLCSS